MDLHLIKQPLLFLSGINTALPTLVMVNLWQGIPFFVDQSPGRAQGD